MLRQLKEHLRKLRIKWLDWRYSDYRPPFGRLLPTWPKDLCHRLTGHQMDLQWAWYMEPGDGHGRRCRCGLNEVEDDA